MQEVGLQTIRRIVAVSADMMRRATRCLPASLRMRLRDGAEWLDRMRPAPPIEDWSGPLIPSHSGTAALGNALIGASATAPAAGVVEPVRSDRRAAYSAKDAPSLRCLVVTALLDVGGMDEVVAFLARRLPGQGLQTAVLHAMPDPSPTGEPTGRLGRMLRSNGWPVRGDVLYGSRQPFGPPVELPRERVIALHGAA